MIIRIYQIFVIIIIIFIRTTPRYCHCYHHNQLSQESPPDICHLNNENHPQILLESAPRWKTLPFCSNSQVPFACKCYFIVGIYCDLVGFGELVAKIAKNHNIAKMSPSASIPRCHLPSPSVYKSIVDLPRSNEE